jgi:hypothetical protein
VEHLSNGAEKAIEGGGRRQGEGWLHDRLRKDRKRRSAAATKITGISLLLMLTELPVVLVLVLYHWESESTAKSDGPLLQVLLVSSRTVVMITRDSTSTS